MPSPPPASLGVTLVGNTASRRSAFHLSPLYDMQPGPVTRDASVWPSKWSSNTGRVVLCGHPMLSLRPSRGNSPTQGRRCPPAWQRVGRAPCTGRGELAPRGLGDPTCACQDQGGRHAAASAPSVKTPRLRAASAPRSFAATQTVALSLGLVWRVTNDPMIIKPLHTVNTQ